jgi:exopolysaccharide production protein ExoZ
LKSKAVLANVQVCRALAALIVVVGHSLHDLDTIAARAGLAPVGASINWGAGIDIFFVISGFIMVYVAGPDFTAPGASWRFLGRRLARVAPLYWLTTTALIAGAMIAPTLLNVPIGEFRHIAFSYLFIPDWRPDMSIVRPVMALGWTLNYEMLFYAVFAATMTLPFRVGVLAMTSVFVSFALVHTLFDIRQTQLAFWTDPIALEFVLGVYVGWAHRAGWRLPALPAMAMGAVGLLLVVGNAPEALGLATSVNFLRYGVPATLLVAAAALGPAMPETRAVNAAVVLGGASYALYLSHPFVIRPMREIWLAAGGAALPGAAFPIVCSAVAIGVAMALHRYAERPLERTMRRLLDRRRLWRVAGAARSASAELTRGSGAVIADSRP